MDAKVVKGKTQGQDEQLLSEGHKIVTGQTSAENSAPRKWRVRFVGFLCPARPFAA